MSWKLFALTMKYPVLIWLGLALVAIFLFGGLALRGVHETNVPDPYAPDVNNLPIYPGAFGLTRRDHISVESKDDGTGHMVQTGTQVMGKYIDYQTSARPEDVLDFYKRVMPERGWPTPESGWATATTEPGWPTPGPLSEFTIYFTYSHAWDRFPLGDAYTQLMVTLTVKATGNGVTSVELLSGL